MVLPELPLTRDFPAGFGIPLCWLHLLAGQELQPHCLAGMGRFAQNVPKNECLAAPCSLFMLASPFWFFIDVVFMAFSNSPSNPSAVLPLTLSCQEIQPHGGPTEPSGQPPLPADPSFELYGAPPGAATGLELFGAALQPGLPSAGSLNAARGRAPAGCSPPPRLPSYHPAPKLLLTACPHRNRVGDVVSVAPCRQEARGGYRRQRGGSQSPVQAARGLAG